MPKSQTSHSALNTTAKLLQLLLHSPFFCLPCIQIPYSFHLLCHQATTKTTMLRRFSYKSKQNHHRPSSSTSSLPPPPLEEIELATRSTSLPSPTVSLTTAYSLALQTKSYNDIWTKIEHTSSSSSNHLVSQVLQPNRELVDQALHRVKPTNLTRLVSLYFEHSEQTSHLLSILLYHSIDRARLVYAPLHDLLSVLPVDSLSQPQCDRAFDIFHQFNTRDNPFPHPISDTFEETRLCFSQLKQQLDYRLKKARKNNRFHRQFMCVGAQSLTSRRVHHINQLDAAAKGAYVLNNDLDTIDRLVAKLHGVVESDKVLVRIGLERGRDRYPIQEVVKQLKKNHSNFLNQLKDLEEHVCLCFVTVNRARSLLLQEIHLQENM